MPYIILTFCIIAEVIGSACLKASEGFTKFWPSAGTLVSFILCFYLMSKTIQHLSLNITYASWAGLGIVLTTIISVIFFKESVNLTSILGIVLIVVGVVILNIYGPGH